MAAEIIVKIKERRFAEAHADISSDGPLNRASVRMSKFLLKAFAARAHRDGCDYAARHSFAEDGKTFRALLERAAAKASFGVTTLSAD